MFPLLVAASLAAPQPPAEPEEKFPALVKKAAAATVRVTNLGSDFRISSGVTIAVQDGFAYVLTAYHALGQGGERQIDFFTDKSGTPEPGLKTQPSDIQILIEQPTADFAVLKVTLPRKGDVKAIPPVARLALPLDRPKRFPASAYTVGCSKSKDGGSSEPPTILPNTIIGKRLKRDKSELAILWETESENEPGRSGGPLVDKDGRVIGVCLANDTSAKHGMFAHLDEIQAAMKRNGHSSLYEGK